MKPVALTESGSCFVPHQSSPRSPTPLPASDAILQGVLYNLHPINGDYEFGPLLAAMFMTTQATIGLVSAARSWELPLRGNA